MVLNVANIHVWCSINTKGF